MTKILQPHVTEPCGFHQNALKNCLREKASVWIKPLNIFFYLLASELFENNINCYIFVTCGRVFSVVSVEVDDWTPAVSVRGRESGLMKSVDEVRRLQRRVTTSTSFDVISDVRNCVTRTWRRCIRQPITWIASTKLLDLYMEGPEAKFQRDLLRDFEERNILDFPESNFRQRTTSRWACPAPNF